MDLPPVPLVADGAWCPGGLADWPAEAAEVELARRWLHAYGPATADDLRWWAGWGKTQLSRVLTELKPAEVDLDGVPGIALADDLAPAGGGAVGRTAARAGLHPDGLAAAGLVPRPARPAAVRPAGNIGPTVWWDGRIVGGWAQARSGEIVCRFLEDAGSAAAAAVEAAAQRLAACSARSGCPPGPAAGPGWSRNWPAEVQPG